MVAAGSLQSSALDMPTLSFVAVCIATLLGVFLILAWLQQRNMRALAWWGVAYLIGAASMLLWSAPVAMFSLPSELPAALIFVACGMIWNGVRLFNGRRPLPVGAFAGAIIWLVLCRLPVLPVGSDARVAFGAVIVAAYTLFIAFDLWRERRKSLYSRTSAIVVPCTHAAIFLMPLAMRAFQPVLFADSWLTVFALETIIYAVGTAFIMLMMVEDQHVRIYRSAANTDELTGLLNRRAFMESARTLCKEQAERGGPVTLMMLDLDHFKSINDRFGHAVGDDVLRTFAQVARSSVRENDIIARFGGEEFAVIVPEPKEFAPIIAERIRASFEAAGRTVGTHAIGATVSTGAATSYEPVMDIDALILRADAALYYAKDDGRNCIRVAEDETVPDQRARLIAAARYGQEAKREHLLQRKNAARRAKNTELPTIA